MSARIESDPVKRKALAADMNLSVLKRSDESIRKVLSCATHVAMYELIEEEQKWKRCDIEGSLFIVERDINHFNNPDHIQYRIVIINRKSLNNYTDDIILGNKDIELNETTKTIMYSNSKGVTVGIWFYELKEAQDIFNLIKKIINSQPIDANSKNNKINNISNNTTTNAPTNIVNNNSTNNSNSRPKRPARRQHNNNSVFDNTINPSKPQNYNNNRARRVDKVKNVTYHHQQLKSTASTKPQTSATNNFANQKPSHKDVPESVNLFNESTQDENPSVASNVVSTNPQTNAPVINASESSTANLPNVVSVSSTPVKADNSTSISRTILSASSNQSAGAPSIETLAKVEGRETADENTTEVPSNSVDTETDDSRNTNVQPEAQLNAPQAANINDHNSTNSNNTSNGTNANDATLGTNDMRATFPPTVGVPPGNVINDVGGVHSEALRKHSMEEIQRYMQHMNFHYPASIHSMRYPTMNGMNNAANGPAANSNNANNGSGGIASGGPPGPGPGFFLPNHAGPSPHGMHPQYALLLQQQQQQKQHHDQLMMQRMMMQQQQQQQQQQQHQHQQHQRATGMGGNIATSSGISQHSPHTQRQQQVGTSVGMSIAAAANGNVGVSNGLTIPGMNAGGMISTSPSSVAPSMPNGRMDNGNNDVGNDKKVKENHVQHQSQEPLSEANGIAVGISMAQVNGEVGGDRFSFLKREEFRAILQRSLTDRKLFDSVYNHYTNVQQRNHHHHTNN